MLDVDLVDDAGAGRDDLEVVERALAPAQELVALAVALVLDLDVALERLGRAEDVGDDGVVDDHLGRRERVDLGGVAAELGHRLAHRGEVDDAGHAGEVLHDHARRRELDLLVGVRVRVPAGDRLDVVGGDVGAVLGAEQVLEQHLEREGQALDVEALTLHRVEAEDLVGLSVHVQGALGTEAVLTGHQPHLLGSSRVRAHLAVAPVRAGRQATLSSGIAVILTSRYHRTSQPLPVPTLLHLNGPSGVGKSTLARLHAAPHPGTLVCDIDDLRSWVSGWADDFVGTGEAVRASALALMTAYLATGRDVVLPQLIVTPAQVDRFEAAAAEAGATYVGVVLTVEPDLLLQRLHARAATPVTTVISRIIEERGGDALVLEGRQQLLDLAPERGWTVVDATDRDTAPARHRAGRGALVLADPRHLVEPLQQLVRRQLDLLVPPLRGPVDARDEAAAVDPAEVAVDERVAGLGLVVGALGQPEVPRAVVLPRVLLEVGVLRLGVGLHVAPVAVEDVLLARRSACGRGRPRRG